MHLQRKDRFWIITLAVAWCFDLLFWDKPAGVSFLVFTALTLAAGLYLAKVEGTRPAARSLWLLLPVAIFALATALRLEPLTRFLNHLLTLLLLAIFAHTFSSGRWPAYSLTDYLAVLARLFIAMLAYPIQVFSSKPSQTTGEDADAESAVNNKPPARWRRALPVLRGLLIALPVVLFFAALLAAADPIFSDYIDGLLDIFRFENLPEYVFRTFYILILGYLLAGVYLHALAKSGDEQLIGLEKPWLPPFLGFTEAAITLGSVDALFAIFVGVQFRYFFGGQANIRLNGYTFAEYARRGFGELVAVAFFSLLLFLGLSAISKRELPGQKRGFSGLGIALVILVGVILVSAFQRLLLYESAYGFSRLRMYAHVFMIWLGVLLLAVLILEILGRQRAFALAALAAALGFAISLNLMNVDGMIVQQNVGRALEGQALDPYYLNSLSVDAIPALIEAHQERQLPAADRNEISAILACQAILLQDARQSQPWQAYHWARARALNQLQNYTGDLSQIDVYENEAGYLWVQVNAEDRPCQYDPFEYY